MYTEANTNAHTRVNTHMRTHAQAQVVKSLSALMGDVRLFPALQGSNMSAKQTTPFVTLNTTCKSTVYAGKCMRARAQVFLGEGITQSVQIVSF